LQFLRTTVKYGQKQPHQNVKPQSFFGEFILTLLFHNVVHSFETFEVWWDFYELLNCKVTDQYASEKCRKSVGLYD